MMKLVAVATLTFRELLRRKVQVNLLIFGVALVVASYAISLLTLGHMHRIVSDLGLSAMEGIGTLLAVFLGATLISGDVERRIVYPVISKPVSRTQYIVGRYLGLVAALLLNLLLMGTILSVVLALEARGMAPVNRVLAGAIAMLGVQYLVVAAIAVLFSCITNGTLAAIFTLSIAVAGHLTNEMRSLWRAGATWLPTLLWYALPNLGSLSLNSQVIYSEPIPASAWMAALYGLLYATSALAIASLAFERRDLR